jgi:hypothetical protein
MLIHNDQTLTRPKSQLKPCSLYAEPSPAPRPTASQHLSTGSPSLSTRLPLSDRSRPSRSRYIRATPAPPHTRQATSARPSSIASFPPCASCMCSIRGPHHTKPFGAVPLFFSAAAEALTTCGKTFALAMFKNWYHVPWFVVATTGMVVAVRRWARESGTTIHCR